jgi:hypothetical protein
MDESNIPKFCPKCKDMDQCENAQDHVCRKKSLRGPFTQYKQRVNETYFDLAEKYLECPNCGEKITVIDFQVLVDQMAATLPPEKARAFSIKIMDLYDDSRDYAIEVLSILTGDLASEPRDESDYLKELEELIQSARV